MYTFEHVGYTYKHVAKKRHVITDPDGVDHIVRFVPADRPMQDIDVKRIIEHNLPNGEWSHERLAQYEEAELLELIIQHEDDWHEYTQEELDMMADAEFNKNLAEAGIRCDEGI